MTIKKPLDLSIDYLTGIDISLLNSEKIQFPTEVIYRDYCWQIRIPDNAKLLETTLQMRAIGFSASFAELIISATNSGCIWISIDVNSSSVCIRDNYQHIESCQEDDKYLNRSQASQARNALSALKCYNMNTLRNIEIDEELTIDLIMDLLLYCEFRKWDPRMIFLEALEYYQDMKYDRKYSSLQNPDK